MNIELTTNEKEILQKILNSYLSELRLEIAATKRDTASLHEEENIVQMLLKRISELK